MNNYNQIKRYYDALLKKYQIIWSVGLPAEVFLKILSRKHSSSRWYVQAPDLNCSLQVSVFVHRHAKLWNC